MSDRKVINPKVLLPVAAVALVMFSAIAIFVAVGYTPDSGSRGAPAAPATETSTTVFQPPPPPIMLPQPMPQVPCMGWAGEGCDPSMPTSAPAR